MFEYDIRFVTVVYSVLPSLKFTVAERVVPLVCGKRSTLAVFGLDRLLPPVFRGEVVRSRRYIPKLLYQYR